MANMKLNRKIFEKEIGKLTEEMQQKIAMFGTTVESLNETEFEININPNRPDLLSYHGFKRSFLGFLGKNKGLINYKINKPEKDYKVIIDSSVKDVRPYTACAIVKGLKFDDERIKEIVDIQEKLHLTVGRKRKKLAIGIYPLEKIKLPITYKALEPDKIKFVPLESNKEMTGLEILQRHPAGRDYAHLLAGKTKFPIFVDAENNVLSMPPIINSELTGKITEKTQDVFVECSGFDIEILEKCLNIIVTSMAEIGGKIYQMELNYSKPKITPDLKTEKMKISLENTNKLLGLNLSEKELKECLEKMGHDYSKGFAEISPWRSDILHEVDLIEDVAIAYGYERFVPEIPEISTIGEENPDETIKRKIAEILSGLNLLEVSSYYLTTKKDQFTKMGVVEKQEKNFVSVEESKTEYNILRKDIAHYLLKILSENVDSEYPQRIFELGKVFTNKEKITGPGFKEVPFWEGISFREKESLAVAIAPGNFTDMKQILFYLFKMIGLEIILKETEETPLEYIDGRVAEILLENKSVGFIGEIHPKILKNWKIKMPVALFEISLKKIFEKLI